MKTIIATILTIVWGHSFCQPMTRYAPMFETCEQAIKQAHVDADAGILRSISHGLLISTREYELDRFYENYLISKYGIESYNAGCIIMEHEECYIDEMDKIINNKFGEDFFKVTEELVEREYKKFKTLGQEEKKQYINFDYTYRLTDTRADYSKGYKELYKEIRKRIDFSTLDFSPYEYEDIGIYLVIGLTGTIEKCEVVSIGFPRSIAEIIENEILKIGNWVPAKLYGFNVKSDETLAFQLKSR